MRVIADENLNALFISDLRASGYEVISIQENFCGIPDEQVASLAKADDVMLITEDKDFGELIFAHKIAKITVIFLRYQKSEVEWVRNQLLRVVQIYQEKEGHFFVTIAKGKVRVSEL